MDFMETVKNRYSCKNFDGRPVPQDKLNAILEAGRLAPTAKNLQEQHIYVAQTPQALAKIDGVTPCRYGASTVLVVAFDRNNVFTYPGEQRDSGVEDASIVATHLMLAAAALGVDSCWINFFDPAVLARDVGPAGARRNPHAPGPGLCRPRLQAPAQPHQPQASL